MAARALPLISGAEERRARRFTTLRHLADLFDRYALHRPEMVRAWAGGARGETPTQWQAELWRRLRARIGVPDLAERVDAACARLRADPALVDLPPRISIFGLTRLPAGQLHVLNALAAGRDVHLFLLHPSPRLWDNLAEATEHGQSIARRKDDPTAALPANRLLASWGQDAREMQLVLGASEHADHHHPVEHSHRHAAGPHPGRRQGRPRAARRPAPGRRGCPAAAGPRRPQRRSSTRATDARARSRCCATRSCTCSRRTPTLEPRDVIVMCPDIETFAPLIQATFGAGEVTADDDQDEMEALPADIRPPDLRVRLADRALRQTNPVLGVVARLVDLAQERVTASQVLDLVDREPVRRRFGLDDDDLARIEDWVARQRHPLGARRGAPGAVQARRAGRRHVAQPVSIACSWA